MHITLPDDLVDELDRRAGKGRRSSYIAEMISQTLEDARRWDQLKATLGSIEDDGHAWDEDPAAWVAAQRRTDAARVG